MDNLFPIASSIVAKHILRQSASHSRTLISIRDFQ